MCTGDGSAYLMGTVPTEGDRDRLSAKLTKLLGESREIDLTVGIDTK